MGFDLFNSLWLTGWVVPVLLSDLFHESLSHFH